jgi:hypothetical protein
MPRVTPHKQAGRRARYHRRSRESVEHEWSILAIVRWINPSAASPYLRRSRTPETGEGRHHAMLVNFTTDSSGLRKSSRILGLSEAQHPERSVLSRDLRLPQLTARTAKTLTAQHKTVASASTVGRQLEPESTGWRRGSGAHGGFHQRLTQPIRGRARSSEAVAEPQS